MSGKSSIRVVLRWLPACALVAFFFLSLAQVWDAETGFTRLIRFGDFFAPRAVPVLAETAHYTYPDNYGYDAQFYAQMAFDPLLQSEATADAMDNAPYRFRRIFMSCLAWLGGLGQPAATLNVFVLLNPLAWASMGALLLHWIQPLHLDGFIRWAGSLLSLGAIMSFTHALADLPAMALILVALRWHESNRPHRAAAALSIAILTKETAVLAGILRLDGFAGGWKEWQKRLLFGLIALLPMAGWIAYLTWRGFNGNTGSPNNFAPPGFGIVGEVREALTFFANRRDYNLVAVFSLVVQALGLLFYWTPKSALWRIGIVHLVLALLLGRSVWEGDPGAAYRVLLPLTVAFNLLVPRDCRWKWLWLIPGNLSALIGLDYLFKLW